MRLSDYALLGDCHSAALVGKNGSVDWVCFPRFDSPALFCRLLDPRGGSLGLAPVGRYTSHRAYLPDTLVLVTWFHTPTGILEVTDCMPMSTAEPMERGLSSHHSLLRRARCVEGEVRTRLVVAPRLEYGSFVPRSRLTSPNTAELVGGADALWVTATLPLEGGRETLRGRWNLRQGEEVWVEAAWSSSLEERESRQHPSEEALRQRLATTIEFWKRWISRCHYQGPHAEAVRRSALTLKALTYAPSGAVVAAPTTSLPEEEGGVRNWDYRYTWLRDTSLTLISLLVLGYQQEAHDFRHWLRRTSAGRSEDVQIMYGILGHRLLPELNLPHLSGFNASAPVRVGNGAVKQLQLDAYGELLQAAWLYVKVGGELTATNWDYLSGLAELVRNRWRLPDQGLWEVRGPPRHFLHSKLLCWVALDRAVRIAKARRMPGPIGRWSQERDAIRRLLLEESARVGWFPQAVGSMEADASTLLMPAFGLVSATDERVTRTMEEVCRQLGQGPLLRRYASDDGVPGDEGAFLLCSFWWVDVLLHQRRAEEAEQLLESLLGLSNDVGLWGEEASFETGEPLGNFPQAFTHMALVHSCAQLAGARLGRLPGTPAYDFSEFALTLLSTLGSQREKRAPVDTPV